MGPEGRGSLIRRPGCGRTGIRCTDASRARRVPVWRTPMTSSTPPPAVHRPEAGPLDAEPLDPATLAGVLRDLLDENPSALTFALDAAATRVPLPDHDRFAGGTTLPGDQPTAIDYVVPADRLAVIRCWERARSVGLGRAGVRLTSRPERTVTLTIVDCRPQYGVWIGVLVPEGGWGTPADE